MADPVVLPINQFSDADGHPYAGGSIATYIPSSSTPKTTYLDAALTAANTNPVILDSAGRATMYGDGKFRLLLRDAAGNLIFDVEATTIVSAAMAPVVEAPTIADAVALLGIDDLIAAEAAARVSADNTETTARIAADVAEANTRATNVTDLQTALTAEQTNRIIQDNILQAEIDALSGGSGTTPSFRSGIATTLITPTLGNVHITFSPPFATACTAVVCTATNASFPVGFSSMAALTFTVSSLSTTGVDVFCYGAGSPSGPVDIATQFCWIATGH